jgi:FKBP-type peptidyl-prolyl cis-trans isomerase FklB
MKLITLPLGIVTAAILSTASAEPLETLDQRLSYILGQNIAAQIEELGFTFDQEAFRLAIDEAALDDDKKRSLSDDDIRKTIQEAQKQSAEKREKEMAALSEKNLQAGTEYRAANAKKEGVVITDSGLQYKEIKAGSGEMPKPTDKVKVHYKGTLINGEVFDSSYERGEPVTFPVTGVIKGWVEALQLMNVGDTFQLTIPPEIAYGAAGTGSIGPNETLLFDVELLEIVE